MLVIKAETYKIKLGVEVFSIEYPSFDEARAIAKDMDKAGDNGDKAIDSMKKWMIDLGLEEKFFSLREVKAHHIMQIWKEINTVKK